MPLIADTTACVGAGQCALVAEDLFDQDDDGIVEVLERDPAPEQEADARRAVALCPAHALRLDP
ncbi:ferredoxin [Brachybacterium sp. YJGR34]|uniref:ferredoxin n=1 Tax=Brachybacterium sp. YJGR34 TaxID=2059911 RepID=UPI000E0B49F1|nr:ferredoxin [Brachybacterium sp. YJGR34]